MPVSPPTLPASRRNRAAGFTLLEILVVVIVIGVIVSAATLSVGVLGRDREAEDQMQRVWAVLRQTREEAELQSIDVGMFVFATGYEFLRYDGRERRWIPIEDDRLLAPRELPEGLRFRLWLESREIVLSPSAVDRTDDADSDEDDEEEENSDSRLASNDEQKWQPQVFVLSSGDIAPFELQVERDSEQALWRVVALPDTDLRLERRPAREPWELIRQTKPPEDDKKDPRNAQTKR